MANTQDRNTGSNFLGCGWSFPPSFDKESGGVKLVVGRQDIDQSLEILLSTRLGERILQPRYGCDLQDYVFSPINNSFETFIRELVRTAILYFEPRIRIELIEIEKDRLNEGLLTINIEYTIRTTNSRFNFVFPFFVNESLGADLGTLTPVQNPGL